jgi:hypothetical protein
LYEKVKLLEANTPIPEKDEVDLMIDQVMNPTMNILGNQKVQDVGTQTMPVEIVDPIFSKKGRKEREGSSNNLVGIGDSQADKVNRGKLMAELR